MRDEVPKPPGERLLTAAESAEIMRISLTAVYRLVRSGELRSHRFGKGKLRPRGLRIPESAVEDYFRATQTVPATPAA